jgi:hypothetical protein
MNKALLIFLLLFSGCGTATRIKSVNSPPPSFVHIKFEDIDLNEDGNITSTEVSTFSERESLRRPKPEISAPIWATIGIAGTTLVMCVLSALIRCSKSE